MDMNRGRRGVCGGVDIIRDDSTSRGLGSFTWEDFIVVLKT